MREYYYNENVYSASLRRIEYIFDNFEQVVVGFSGGKDSTVVLQLALQVAEKKNRLPLEVFFIDQEGEWDCTIDYVRQIMYDPRVKPAWLQVPMVLFNATATNGHDQWLHCWYPGEKWLRDKDPISIKENTYGTERFHELFSAYIDKTYPDKSVAYLAGVRCEESPKRKINITGAQKGKPLYKWIFWGKVSNAALHHYTFYPIYDWDFRDVWKAIHDNGWPYCKLYDYQFQHGVKVRDMRVSNVHHETAIQNLWYMQEVEPDLWNRLTERLDGINTSAVLNKELFEIKELPYMFKDWEEYRDYLLENLITDEERREAFRTLWGKTFHGFRSTWERCKVCDLWKEEYMKVCVKSLLKNDFEGTLIVNFFMNSATTDLNTYIKTGACKKGFKPEKFTLAYKKQMGIK